MQQQRADLKDKVLVGFMTMVWVSGLILAGSDGPLMPYLNLLGGLQFFGASCLLGRLLPRLDTCYRSRAHMAGLKQGRSMAVLPNYRRPTLFRKTPGKTQGVQALAPRYARELGIV